MFASLTAGLIKKAAFPVMKALSNNRVVLDSTQHVLLRGNSFQLFWNFNFITVIHFCGKDAFKINTTCVASGAGTIPYHTSSPPVFIGVRVVLEH